MGTTQIPNMGRCPYYEPLLKSFLNAYFFITMVLYSFAGFVMDNKLRGKWSQQSLAAAVLAVLMENCSKKKAATIYGIPRGTLQRYIKKAEA